jgi:biopolymer transport protein TolR
MRKKHRPITEINITPFTDVVLVLLIIFVVIAPIMFKYDINISLPQTSFANKAQESQRNLSFTVTETDDIYINNEKYNIKTDSARITKELNTVFAGNKDAEVFINGDKRCKYESVMNVITLLNNAGAKKILLGVEFRNK